MFGFGPLTTTFCMGISSQATVGNRTWSREAQGGIKRRGKWTAKVMARMHFVYQATVTLNFDLQRGNVSWPLCLCNVPVKLQECSCKAA